tara:strand:- start:4619 stop:4990 length:372 start_codon:yes stop_codon:yes gene_type:complete
MNRWIYVLLDNLDIEYNRHSAGYHIKQMELCFEVGDGYDQNGDARHEKEYLKKNLDEVILNRAQGRASRSWSIELNGYRVSEIFWCDKDGEYPLDDDWNYSVWWEGYEPQTKIKTTKSQGEIQ